MRSKTILILTLLFTSFNLIAQDDEKLAYQKAKEAIELMDEGKFDESIELLKESEKLDKKNYYYPYEIALAYTYKKDYKQAIKFLKKTLKYDGINSQVFQLLGNNYSMAGDKEDAIETYKKGIKKFPDAGNLYLETGNIFLMEKDYNQAIENYEKGVEANPLYPSNYYRLAQLFLTSNDKVSGLIYGEIFMNLERTTDRTIEISKLLFECYNESITFSGDSSSIDFCEIILDPSMMEGDEIKFPFCAIFGKNFILSIIDQKEINLKSLSEIRTSFLEFFFQEDAGNYPNVLYDYHKKMKDQGVFKAYNYYLFQMSNQEEFEKWYAENESEFQKFVEWYTTEKNYLEINNENKFVR